mmetsp:Transcript_39565/g.60461  ORF Transcript_39565/g.60461 Transcript_39565/m.60461 type:complete len:120 (+) Transcript_39565:712-1071(+)
MISEDNVFDEILLENLDTFIEHHNTFKEADTSDIDSLYSENPSAEEKELIRQMKIEQFLKNHCFLLEVFEHLYFQVFKLFNDTWVDQRPGIMNFTQILQNVFTDVFLPKSHHFLKEYIF